MTRIHERDIVLADGRTLHVYETKRHSRRLPIMWHHGTPNVGSPPEPLMAAAKDAGLRWVSFDRPGYGGSSRHEGRTVADTARDALAVANALGVDRFAVMGHSGGGPHALAVAALAPDRVAAVTTSGGLAPLARTAGDVGLELDAWFDGMGKVSATSLRAALDGADAKRAYEASAGDGIDFTSRDWAALGGEWGWLGTVAAAGVASGPDALIDDDLAYVQPWGVDLGQISAPTLLVHGADDRVVPASHSRWLAQAVPGAVHWQLAGEGHISTLADDERGAAAAVRWVGEHLAAS